MEDRMDAIRSLNNKISYLTEQYLVETYDYITDYVIKSRFFNDKLEFLIPSDIKRIISSYFKELANDIVPELQLFINNKIQLTEEHIKESNDINSISSVLDYKQFEEYISNQMNVAINYGLKRFTDNFKKDLENELISKLPEKIKNSNDFNESVQSFRVGLFDRIETDMTDYKKYITNTLVNRYVDEIGKYQELVFQERKRRTRKERKKTTSKFRQFVNSIYDENKELIESNNDLKESYTKLYSFYKDLESKGTDFNSLSDDQITEFNKLTNNLINKGKEIALKEKNTNESLNKVKSINNKEESKELPQDEVSSLVDVSEYEIEKNKIINAKHLDEKDKKEMLDNLEENMSRKR